MTVSTVLRPVRSASRSSIGHTSWWVVVFGVGSVALVARLLPVLRGGGLFGLGNYDDGVYFAAAVALAHGVVPYRDFLLLHPPGIVLVLWPFAVLGVVLGSADAFAVARVAFMVLGATNAVLVARVLRELGLPAAVAGGLCYALGRPAVIIGQSTLLETPASTCLLLALLLVRSDPARRVPIGSWWAGLLLGVSAGIKIWNVVVCLTVLLWSLGSKGRRRSLRIALGAAGGVSVVCLPFLAVAGPPMWRMVVLDQLARGGSAARAPVRVADILGLTPWQPGLQGWSAPTVGAASVVVVCCALSWRQATGRLGVLLLTSTTALLLTVPSWYEHYAGLSAAPLALVVGSAVGALVPRRRSWRDGYAVAAVVAVLAGWAGPGLARPFGKGFPAADLVVATRAAGGCVTSDDPTTLIELGALDRNLAEGCPVVVDLSGYSYDLRTPGGQRLTRRQNAAWQQHTLTYLASGTTTTVVRFSRVYALTARSARVVEGWAVAAESRGVRVQRPGP